MPPRRTRPPVPGQRALFSKGLPSRASVDRARDSTMEKVGTAAEERNPGFAEAVRSFVPPLLARVGPLAGEKISLACKEAGYIPHDDRAFGPIYYGMARKGIIEKVGTVRRERGHGTAGGNVWGLVTKS